MHHVCARMPERLHHIMLHSSRAWQFEFRGNNWNKNWPITTQLTIAKWSWNRFCEVSRSGEPFSIQRVASGIVESWKEKMHRYCDGKMKQLLLQGARVVGENEGLFYPMHARLCTCLGYFGGLQPIATLFQHLAQIKFNILSLDTGPGERGKIRGLSNKNSHRRSMCHVI